MGCSTGSLNRDKSKRVRKIDPPSGQEWRPGRERASERASRRSLVVTPRSTATALFSPSHPPVRPSVCPPVLPPTHPLFVHFYQSPNGARSRPKKPHPLTKHTVAQSHTLTKQQATKRPTDATHRSLRVREFRRRAQTDFVSSSHSEAKQLILILRTVDKLFRLH